MGQRKLRTPCYLPRSIAKYLILPPTHFQLGVSTYVSGPTTQNFNKLNKGYKENPDVLTLSILYARIPLFDSLIHVAYKLPITKWQVQSTSDKKTIP